MAGRRGRRHRGPAQTPARIDVVAYGDERWAHERAGGAPSTMANRRGELLSQPGRIRRLHTLEHGRVNSESEGALIEPAAHHEILRAIDLSREHEPSGDVLPEDEPRSPAALVDDPGDHARGLICELDAQPVRRPHPGSIRGRSAPRDQGRQLASTRGSRKCAPSSAYVIWHLEDVPLARELGQRFETPVESPAGDWPAIQVEDVERQEHRREIGCKRRTGGKTPSKGGEIGASLGVEDRDDAVEQVETAAWTDLAYDPRVDAENDLHPNPQRLAGRE